MAISKKKRTSKPKTRRGSKKPKRMTKRTSRKPVVAKRPVKRPVPPPAPPATGPIDFDDEDAVLAEMARELGYEPDQLTIRDTSPPTGVGDSKTYEITSGSKEWFVVENDDAAQELALAAVKNDLENEPEIFNQSFIESHIDLEKLRRELHSDTLNNNEERLREERASDFWREAESYGVSPKFVATGNDADGKDVNLGEFEDESDADEAAGKWLDEKKESDPENADSYDTDVERSDPSDDDITKVAEEMTEGQLKDPMEYLEEIFGKEDATKKAIEIAGIDIDAAAEQAIRDDGAGHFLASYDGQLNETKRGLTYWRHN